MSDLVDVLARAIERHAGSPHFDDAAEEILTALEAAGYRAVPIDPTREMFNAGQAYLKSAGGSRGLIGAWRDMCDIAHPPAAPKVDSPAVEGRSRDG